MENLSWAPLWVEAKWKASPTTKQVVIATEKMCSDVWLKNYFYILKIRYDFF